MLMGSRLVSGCLRSFFFLFILSSGCSSFAQEDYFVRLPEGESNIWTKVTVDFHHEDSVIYLLVGGRNEWVNETGNPTGKDFGIVFNAQRCLQVDDGRQSESFDLLEIRGDDFEVRQSKLISVIVNEYCRRESGRMPEIRIDKTEDPAYRTVFEKRVDGSLFATNSLIYEISFPDSDQSHEEPRNEDRRNQRGMRQPSVRSESQTLHFRLVGNGVLPPDSDNIIEKDLTRSLFCMDTRLLVSEVFTEGDMIKVRIANWEAIPVDEFDSRDTAEIILKNSSLFSLKNKKLSSLQIEMTRKHSFHKHLEVPVRFTGELSSVDRSAEFDGVLGRILDRVIVDGKLIRQARNWYDLKKMEIDCKNVEGSRKIYIEIRLESYVRTLRDDEIRFVLEDRFDDGISYRDGEFSVADGCPELEIGETSDHLTFNIKEDPNRPGTLENMDLDEVTFIMQTLHEQKDFFKISVDGLDNCERLTSVQWDAKNSALETTIFYPTLFKAAFGSPPQLKVKVKGDVPFACEWSGTMASVHLSADYQPADPIEINWTFTDMAEESVDARPGLRWQKVLRNGDPFGPWRDESQITVPRGYRDVFSSTPEFELFDTPSFPTQSHFVLEENGVVAKGRKIELKLKLREAVAGINAEIADDYERNFRPVEFRVQCDAPGHESDTVVGESVSVLLRYKDRYHLSATGWDVERQQYEGGDFHLDLKREWVERELTITVEAVGEFEWLKDTEQALEYTLDHPRDGSVASGHVFLRSGVDRATHRFPWPTLADGKEEMKISIRVPRFFECWRDGESDSERDRERPTREFKVVPGSLDEMTLLVGPLEPRNGVLVDFTRDPLDLTETTTLVRRLTGTAGGAFLFLTGGADYMTGTTREEMDQLLTRMSSLYSGGSNIQKNLRDFCRDFARSGETDSWRPEQLHLFLSESSAGYFWASMLVDPLLENGLSENLLVTVYLAKSDETGDYFAEELKKVKEQLPAVTFRIVKI